MAVTFRAIADDLRRSIQHGDYQPGDTLPTLPDLATQYGAAYQTVRSAIGMLEQEGLVQAIRKRGTVVRDRPAWSVITRTRQVFRDERGYYFDPDAKPWVALAPPTVEWGPAPPDIGALLQVDARDDVLIRDRLMGPEGGAAQQVATSYLPSRVARGTVLAARNTGPGGIYDRLEEMGHSPLRWSEMITARMPTPRELEALKLPPSAAVLRVIRTTTSPKGEVLEINDTRMSAETYAIGYPIRRSSSARRRSP